MNTAQLLKVVVGLAIACVVYQMLAGRSKGRLWNVQPYEPYEDDEEYEENDYEEDTDDTDMGYEAYAEAEDDDMAMDMGDEVETFANATPAEWGSGGGGSGGGRMNVATDLLPKPTYEAQNFSEFAPKSLLGQNFLDAKRYIGVDTQGSSLRNASRDIRSTPVIPRRNVGPWMQSTIESDLLRKPLE